MSGRTWVPEDGCQDQQDAAGSRQAWWEVRPLVLAASQVEPADLQGVEAELRLVARVAVGMLAVGPRGGQALGATLVVQAQRQALRLTVGSSCCWGRARPPGWWRLVGCRR